MPGTRSSARKAEKNANSSPPSAKSTGSSSTKRKAEELTPTGNKSKRGRPSKEQKTLEESMPSDEQHDTQMPETESEVKVPGRDFQSMEDLWNETVS